MGSGKGSTTQQSSTAQSNTYTPSPYAMAAYNDALSRAQSAANLPYTAYSGELVAPVNAQQYTGIGDINQYANAAQPYFGTATGYATTGATPLSTAQINQYYNPYQQQVINATQGQFNLMNQEALNNISGNAASVGALGGTGADRAKALYYGATLPGQEAQIAGLEQTGYQQALSTAEQQKQDAANAAYQFYTLGMGAQNAGLQGAQAQVGAGTLEQQVQQQLDAALMQQFYQAQAFPYAQSQFLTGATGAIAPSMGGTSQGYGTGTQITTPPVPNPVSQMLGLGLTGASIFGQGFGTSALGALGIKDGGKVPGFDAGGAPSGGAPSYIAGVGGMPYGTVPYINPGQIQPARSMQPQLGAGVQFSSPSQPQNPLAGLSDISKLLGNKQNSIQTPSYYGGSAGNQWAAAGQGQGPWAPAGGVEAGDSAESLGLGADAAAAEDAGAAAEAGVGTSALADAGSALSGIGAGIGSVATDIGAGLGTMFAGAGSAIADVLPFLALAKRGGRIKGYDDGGDVDVPDYVPTTSGFGSVFAGADPLAGVARGSDTSEPAGLPSLANNDAQYQSAVKKFEGYEPRAKWDYAQYSNGYGTRAKYPGERIDRETADARFQDEWWKAANAVDQRFPGLDTGPRNALTSLTYNAGAGWMNQGLGRAVASGDMGTAARLMQGYNHAGGQPLQGLTDRRREEASWMLGKEPGVGDAMAFAGPSEDGGVSATAYRDTPDIIRNGPDDNGTSVRVAQAGVGREPVRPTDRPIPARSNWDKLFDLGVGMLSSRSPYFGVAVGEGGKYVSQQGHAATSEAQSQARINNEAQRLHDEAEYHRQLLAKQNTALDIQKERIEQESWAPWTNEYGVQLGFYNKKNPQQVISNEEMAKRLGKPAKPGQTTAPATPGTTTEPAKPPAVPEPEKPGTSTSPNIARVAGDVPEHVSWFANNSEGFDYARDGDKIPRDIPQGASLPPPKPIAGPAGTYSSSTIQQMAAKYLLDGKPPLTSGTGRNNPFVAQRSAVNLAVQNYANAMLDSQGISKAEFAQIVQMAPRLAQWIVNPQGGGTTAALGTAVRHLNTLSAMGDAYYDGVKTGDFQLYNSLRAKAAAMFGNSDITQTQAGSQLVGIEIMKAMGAAGAGGEGERLKQMGTFNPMEGLSREQFHKNVDGAKRFLAGQLETKQNQAREIGLDENRFHRMVGEDAYNELKRWRASEDKGTTGAGPAAPAVTPPPPGYVVH